MPHEVSRRLVLAGSVGAGAAVLAGCGSSEPDAPTAAASSSPPSSAAPSPAAAPSTAAGTRVAALADVPVGGSVVVKDAAGKDVVVTRTAESTVVALSGTCTHAGCAVAARGAMLACPCHGSVFDATTGAVQQGPATRPLAARAARIEGTSIVIA